LGVENREETAALYAKEGSIEELVFARSGPWLVGGGSDEKAHLWETATGKILRSFEGHANGINGVAVWKDSTILFTTTDDKTARLWDLESGVSCRIRAMSGHSWERFGLIPTNDTFASTCPGC